MKKYPRHVINGKKKVTKWSIKFVLLFNVSENRGESVGSGPRLPAFLSSEHQSLHWAHSSASLVLVLTLLGLVLRQCLLPKAALIIRWMKHSQAVQLLRHVQLFATPWTAAHQASMSITISWKLLKLMSIESVMPSKHLILCRSLLLLPSNFPSIRAFSSESVLCIRWPKYWSFSFSISSSNEYSWRISFRIDWLDLLAVQGSLKSLLQHQGSKVSILQRSAFVMVQHSHPYMTTGKTIVLTRQTFVGRVLSLLFNMLSRLVITFLPRSKHLLISWLQSPSAVILEPKKIKSLTVKCLQKSQAHCKC